MYVFISLMSATLFGKININFIIHLNKIPTY